MRVFLDADLDGLAVERDDGGGAAQRAAPAAHPPHPLPTGLALRVAVPVEPQEHGVTTALQHRVSYCHKYKISRLNSC